ncbi:sensor histidine kinase [Paenibacillus rhizovicinus]|uniref:Sensor histidine kinase n=1 Tax=Paenibacillus rhizovicinus TaxID=2704463 RepID=A0A6C0P552_9BACL|nr:sensor histidine kinase [Paenibacillus rhizovicinus]QHW33471.1 sensor histidine kinase [Paenibacillus rhizovicinus]
MKRAITGLLNRLRFKQKLFLSYLVVIIIPILVLGVYAYNQSKEMLRIQGIQGIVKNVDTISGSIDGSVERYNHAVQSIVLNKTFQKIVTNDYSDLVNLSYDLQEYLTPYFNMMVMLDQEIDDVKFYTQTYVPEYGDSVQSADRVKDEDWYQSALKGKGSQWFSDNGLIVVAAFPRFFSDKATNLVYMRINEASMFKNVAALAKDGTVAITNDRGDVIYSNQGATGERLEAGQLQGMKEGAIRIGGIESYLVKKTVKQTGWTIYFIVPAKELSRNAGSIINATLIVIAGCIVIVLIMIWMFSKTMIRRIYALNSVMKRVEIGDLSIRIRSESKDEIGELTNRFGSMLARLNDLIDELFRNKIVQKEAEFKALQWQMNPHFLYNTLSFINWKALRSDDADISRVVTTLSKFYRTGLNRGNNMIPVRDELEHVKSYIEIIQTMKDHSFDVEYDIDEAVFGHTTINFILQPLAENAIMHGIARKESGRGLLRISAKLSNGKVVFQVQDNGIGMPLETANTLLQNDSSGYGMKNVNERLRLKYSSDYSFTVESAVDRGTQMSIVIPAYLQS